jgi:hypothetical protein
VEPQIVFYVGRRIVQGVCVVSADECVVSRDSKYKSMESKEFNVDISVGEVIRCISQEKKGSQIERSLSKRSKMGSVQGV